MPKAEVFEAIKTLRLTDSHKNLANNIHLQCK